MTRNSKRYKVFDQYMRRHPETTSYKGSTDIVELYRAWEKSWRECISKKEEMLRMLKEL